MDMQSGISFSSQLTSGTHSCSLRNKLILLVVLLVPTTHTSIYNIFKLSHFHNMLRFSNRRCNVCNDILIQNIASGDLQLSSVVVTCETSVSLILVTNIAKNVLS